MGIDMKQFDRFLTTMYKVQKDFPDFLEMYMGKEGLRIVRQAKKRTPVKTGALRNAWKTSDVRFYGLDAEIDILNGQDYATFIEYGTCKGIKPYRMVTVPLQEMNAEMPQRFFKEWHKYLKSKGMK